MLSVHKYKNLKIDSHKKFLKRLDSISERLDSIKLKLPEKPHTNLNSHVSLNSNQVKKKSKSLIDPKLKRRSLFAFGGFGICAICNVLASRKSNTSDTKVKHWGYDYNNGPPLWKVNGLCVPDSIQSPINIVKADSVNFMPSDEKSIEFYYGDGDDGYATVINTGHGTMQVNFEENKYFTNIGNKPLSLVQFHFHTPSEHAFDGQRKEMEVHLVHKDVNTGQLSVIGVLMNGFGKPNSALQSCLEEAPHELGKTVQMNVDPNTLLPSINKRSYFNYVGSLTTPPCTENVNWYVFENAIQCSPRQVIKFQQYLEKGISLSTNARPLQDVDGRNVMYAKNV